MTDALAGTFFRDAAKPLGFWSQAWRRLRRNRLALAGTGLILCFVVVALAAPLFAPYDPSAQDYTATFASSSRSHPMGTDNLGRDWLSRLIYGARLSIAVGFFAQLVILSIAVPIGVIAGYLGGRTDNLLMRFADLMYAFPELLFIILLRSVFDGSIFILFLLIGVTTWMGEARLIRGQVLSLKEREFVTAARALGASSGAIMWRHLFPNTLGPLTVVVAFSIPRAIFIEASLSFLGIGVGPETTSWGSMIDAGRGAIFAHPNLVLFPSLALALLMLSFTFVGDGLRDALDPHLAD